MKMKKRKDLKKKEELLVIEEKNIQKVKEWKLKQLLKRHLIEILFLEVNFFRNGIKIKFKSGKM